MKTRQEKINALNQLVNDKWEIDLGFTIRKTNEDGFDEKIYFVKLWFCEDYRKVFLETEEESLEQVNDWELEYYQDWVIDLLYNKFFNK